MVDFGTGSHDIIHNYGNSIEPGEGESEAGAAELPLCWLTATKAMRS